MSTSQIDGRGNGQAPHAHDTATGSHEPIVYPVAAVKTQHSPAAAMGFVQFLLGAEAQAVFAKHGFIPAGSGT